MQRPRVTTKFSDVRATVLLSCGENASVFYSAKLILTFILVSAKKYITSLFLLFLCSCFYGYMNSWLLNDIGILTYLIVLDRYRTFSFSDGSCGNIEEHWELVLLTKHLAWNTAFNKISAQYWVLTKLNTNVKVNLVETYQRTISKKCQFAMLVTGSRVARVGSDKLWKRYVYCHALSWRFQIFDYLSSF